MNHKLCILGLLLIMASSCISQQHKRSQIAEELNRNINRIELAKLPFFWKELVELGEDTSFQSKFIRKIDRLKKMKLKTVSDQKEFAIALHMLYKSLAENNVNNENRGSKLFYLSQLDEHKKLTFAVDQHLILSQIDYGKRGLENGYDEGSVDKSMFTFFTYDPLLYKTTLLKNKLNDDWDRMGVFLCNYLRENENPIVIRKHILERIMQSIGRKEVQNEFESLLKELDQCDISSNLLD